MTLLSPNILNSIRTKVYGSGASLTFYTVTPAAGETSLGDITSGWYAQRQSDSASVKVWIAKQDNIDIDNIRAGAVIGLTIGGQTRRYKITELAEMQQIGTGWVLRCEPVANTV